jgi:hypothetical protein
MSQTRSIEEAAEHIIWHDNENDPPFMVFCRCGGKYESSFAMLFRYAPNPYLRYTRKPCPDCGSHTEMVGGEGIPRWSN